MKKTAMILLTVLTAGLLSTPVFAASNPADDAASYSYSTGRKAYESRMAEDHPWYDNKSVSATCGYSFGKGLQEAEVRNSTFASMPENNVTKDTIEAWFQRHGF